MLKAIVFDLGGTLMEYAGMPLNWSDFYIGGFEKLNEILKLNLSENELQDSATEPLPTKADSGSVFHCFPPRNSRTIIFCFIQKKYFLSEIFWKI